MNKGNVRENGSEEEGRRKEHMGHPTASTGPWLGSARKQQRRAAVQRVTSPPTAEGRFLPRRLRGWASSNTDATVSTPKLKDWYISKSKHNF